MTSMLFGDALIALGCLLVGFAFGWWTREKV